MHSVLNKAIKRFFKRGRKFVIVLFIDGVHSLIFFCIKVNIHVVVQCAEKIYDSGTLEKK